MECEFVNDPYPGQSHWGTLRVTNLAGVTCQEYLSYDGIMYRTWSGGSGWRNWEKVVTDATAMIQHDKVIDNSVSSMDIINNYPQGIYHTQGWHNGSPGGTSGYGILTKKHFGIDTMLEYMDMNGGDLFFTGFGNTGWTGGWRKISYSWD